MGDFSRDPKKRLADSIKKHYVGVRMQQGVPILDADWNELEDLRRIEFETMGNWYIGSGVPAGNDGFCIFAVTKPNDFYIRGGLCIVNGKLVKNNTDVYYSTQSNFSDPNLDEPMLPLDTPSVDKEFIVFLDVWEREVDSNEDPVLVDNRIGIETTIRLKREWVVRVAKEPEDLLKLESPPPDHAFYRLARISRQGNNDNITNEMIKDLRDTQLSLQRKIEVRNNAGVVVVDSQKFQKMLENTRNNVFEFIRYITTKFNEITTHMTSAEVIGLQTGEHIARTAETGIGLIHSESIANRGALNFLFQMYNAENNFMTVWRDVVLQLGDTQKKYAPYENFIQRLDERLHKQTVGPLTGLLPALKEEALEEATKMQEEIARLIGAESTGIPRGSIRVFLTKSPSGNLISGQKARFEFRVQSFTTSEDTYKVTILPEEGWPRYVVDTMGDPIPDRRISIGASGSETAIFIDVEVGPGSSDLQLYVESDSNPTEINHLTGVYSLTEGEPPPIGEDKIQLFITNVSNANLDPTTGMVSIVRNQLGRIEVRVYNNTGQRATFNLTLSKENEVGNWTAEITGSPPIIDNNDSSPEVVKVTPANNAVSMHLVVLAATTIDEITYTGQIVIHLGATT